MSREAVDPKAIITMTDCSSLSHAELLNQRIFGSFIYVIFELPTHRP